MSAPDVVVVDHHDSYTFNLVHLIASVTGVLPRVVQHDEADAAEVLAHSHVVLSPGPGHPDSPRDFGVGREVLLAGTRPVLGVCLGMQGLVAAYGGRVGRVVPAHGDVASIAHTGVGVFAGLPQGFRAVRYHSLAALELPPELEVTAWAAPEDAESEPPESEGGRRVRPGGRERVVMGVRHRTLPLEGVQFHPESILSERGADLVRTFLSR